MDRRLAPGLAVVAAGTLAAYGLHLLSSVLSPVACALAIGALAANARILPGVVRPGCRSATTQLLRVGVVLIGFRMPVGDVVALGAQGIAAVLVVVVATFFGTRWLAGRLGVAADLALLIATGFAICGASAVAAMNGVVDADEEEVGYAIGLVTLCGTLAIVVLPVLGSLFGLDPASFGRWAGASVHDVAQVIATASTEGPAALRAAVVVKLTRISLLAPCVVTVTLARRRSGVEQRPRASGDTVRRPALLPAFVVGFLVAAVLRSTEIVPSAWLDVVQTTEGILITAAMVGLGTGIDLARFRRVGGRPLVLGLGAWVLVGGSSLVIVLFSSTG